jgi:phage terminase small subunit
LAGNSVKRRSRAQFRELPESVQKALAACTPAQQRFVIEYCSRARGNGQLAAQLAGIRGSYSTRASVASQYLSNPAVQAARDAWMSAYAMSAAEVTGRLADLARASMEPFVEVGPGGVLRLRKQDDASWGAFAHWVRAVDVDPDTGRVTRVILHDALRATDLLAKIMKLYDDRLVLQVFFQSMSDEALLEELRKARAAVQTTAVLSEN